MIIRTIMVIVAIMVIMVIMFGFKRKKPAYQVKFRRVVAREPVTRFKGKAFSRTAVTATLGKISQVTARDPVTGCKATALTRGGAIFKLQSMVGARKVVNPQITRGR